MFGDLFLCSTVRILPYVAFIICMDHADYTK
jgi:hypothetical protein